MQLCNYMVRPYLEFGLREELGPGDTTGGFIAGPDDRSSAIVYAKSPGVVCGLMLAEETIRLIEPTAEVTYVATDGDEVAPGDVLLRVHARAQTIFAVERVALDWVQQLSGIATKTRRYAKLVEPFSVRITDTRKGWPGLRMLQKYAVRIGGAHNHLFGLHNAILVKDNHIKMADGIAEAVAILRATAQHTFKIEVECETLEQVQEALDANVEIIMFDNMDHESMRAGVSLVAGRAITEASGNISEESIVDVAKLGVDVISIGDLTRNVDALDVSLDVGEMKSSARRSMRRE